MILRIVVRVATAGLLFFFIAAHEAFSQPADQAVMPPAVSNDAATSQSGGGSAKEGESSPQFLPFPALQGILDDYASLRAGSGYDAAGREFHMGHLKIYFRSGTLYPILTASGKEAGFLFDGSGRYIYTSEEEHREENPREREHERLSGRGPLRGPRRVLLCLQPVPPGRDPRPGRTLQQARSRVGHLATVEAAPEGGRRGLRDRSRRRAGRAGRRLRHGLRPDRQPDR